MRTRRLLQFALALGALVCASQASAQSISVGPGGGGGPSVLPDASSQSAVSASPQGSGQGAGQGAGEGAFSRDIIAGVYNYSDLSDPSGIFRGLALPAQRLYRGVIPGLRDTLPHIRPHQREGLRSRSSRLTWVGYQRMQDKSRVFLQVFDTPAFEVVRGNRDGQLIIVLKDTRIPLSNFRRALDSRWIPRSVSSIRARTVGRDTQVLIQLRRAVEFSVSLDGSYLNIDFDDAFLEGEVGAPVDPNDGNIIGDPDA